MGICRLCGKDAGIMRKEHKECRKKHDAAIQSLPEYMAEHLFSTDISTVVNRVNEQAGIAYVQELELHEVYVRGWERSVEQAFEDGILSQDEEDKLKDLANRLSLNQDELDRKGWFHRLIHGAVLRDLMEGKIPDRLIIDFSLPFNFMKSEELIWLFQNVPYYESVTRTRYAGGTQGVSLKLMKGVYYRTGGFRGERIQEQETRHVDTGLFAVTTKHVYFAGDYKSFRIKYNKIVSFQPFYDGIGIQRDAASAKPQIFHTGDGWFTYNLLMNVQNLG